MSFEDYYGNQRGTTHVEIFSIPKNGGARIVHRGLKDQDAYDTWHLAHYFKEVLSYRALAQRPKVTVADLPRKEKNLLVYLMLAADPKLKTILELGSSLFELIDGLDVTRRYVDLNTSPLPALDSKQYRYLGIELSELLRFAGRELHPDHPITDVATVSAFNGTADLIYDRSVASYALESSAELARFVKRGRVGLLNTLFSLGKTFHSAKVGKALTYFSLDEFLSLVEVPFVHLFGTTMPRPESGEDLSMGNPVIEGFFMFGPRDFIDAFMAMGERDPAIRAYFREKDIRPKDPRALKPR